MAAMLRHICKRAWPSVPRGHSRAIGVHGIDRKGSQDYSGLAWVRYDAAFRRQAALMGNRRWSQINATIYTVCFTGNAQVSSRCELCLGTTHSSKECALRGDPDPEMQARVKAIETAVLALAARRVD